MGAILGYRPPVGSPIGSGNNCRFSRKDLNAIIAWNLRHLSVRLIAVETSAPLHVEQHLIGCMCPILNTTHNAECIAALADLRGMPRDRRDAAQLGQAIT